MNLDLWSFLDMGGYSLYIWSAWGISALSMAMMLWRMLHQYRTVMNQLGKRTPPSSCQENLSVEKKGVHPLD